MLMLVQEFEKKGQEPDWLTAEPFSWLADQVSGQDHNSLVPPPTTTAQTLVPNHVKMLVFVFI